VRSASEDEFMTLFAESRPEVENGRPGSVLGSHSFFGTSLATGIGHCLSVSSIHTCGYWLKLSRLYMLQSGGGGYWLLAED